MSDREKVIKGLEICVNRVPGKYDCYKCPYEIDGNDCEINLSKDALSLLKQQDTASGHWLDDTGHWIYGDRDGTNPHTRITGEMIDTFRCSWCGFYQYWKTPFCPNCGAKMEE